MSGKAKWPWSVLGLEDAPEDAKEIRRAYARSLKQIDQKTEIARFEALREAYGVALDLMEEGVPKAPAPMPAPKPTPAPTPQGAGAAPVPPPALPKPDVAGPDLAEPDLTEADLAEADELQDLLNPTQPNDTLAERIRTVLANPLSLTPLAAGPLRHAIAQAIRQASQPGISERNLPAALDGTLMYWLDLRYGWLSDHAAFTRDFGGDFELLDIMASRAFLARLHPKAPPPRPRGRFERSLDAIFAAGLPRYGLFLLLLVLTHLIPNLLRGSPYQDELEAGILWAILLAGLAYMYTKFRARHSRLGVALRCGWIGIGPPLLIYAPPVDQSTIGRTLVEIWFLGCALWFAHFVARPWIPGLLAWVRR